MAQHNESCLLYTEALTQEKKNMHSRKETKSTALPPPLFLLGNLINEGNPSHQSNERHA